MRPRAREQESPPLSPPRRLTKGSLSSMVVMPDSATDGGGNSETENGNARSSERRHEDAPGEHQNSRPQRFSEDSGYGTRAGSLSPSPRQKSKYQRYEPGAEQSGGLQHRRRSPYPRRPQSRHYDPEFDEPGQRGRRSPYLRRTPEHDRYDQDYEQAGRSRGRGSPLRRRFDRHRYDPDFDRLLEHARDSPFQQRLDHRHYDYGFDQPGPEHGREPWGEKGDGRFRDASPTYGRGRGGRKFRHVSPPYGRGRGGGRPRDVSPPPYGRGRFRDVSPPYALAGDERLYDTGFDEHSPGDTHVRGDHRNDPNLAPRVGDWICKNPSCGNLNFARRECCNKCNKFRFGCVDGGAGASPRRSYSGPPSPQHGPPSPPPPPPPRFSAPQHDRGPRRDANSYRSPPRGWAREGPGGPPPPARNGSKFRGPDLRRGKSEYYEDVGPRGRDRFDREVPNRERYDFIHGRRGFDQQPPSPRSRWGDDPRRRTRSPPPRARSPQKDFARNSYMGRGRGDRYRTWQE